MAGVLVIVTIFFGFNSGAKFSNWTNIVCNLDVIKEESDYGYALLDEIKNSDEDDVVID